MYHLNRDFVCKVLIFLEEWITYTDIKGFLNHLVWWKIYHVLVLSCFIDVNNTPPPPHPIYALEPVILLETTLSWFSKAYKMLNSDNQQLRKLKDVKSSSARKLVWSRPMIPPFMFLLKKKKKNKLSGWYICLLYPTFNFNRFRTQIRLPLIKVEVMFFFWERGSKSNYGVCSWW